MKSAYIHIPFCKTICSYCDFCKMYYYEELVDKYLIELEKEIKEKYKNETIETLYIGGGTPSVLNIKQLKKLFEIIKQIKKSKSIEFTFECNIENITKEKLELLYENHVNRLSIGIQTFNEKFLKFLNRNHTKEEIKEKIKQAKQIGFKNINVDLILGLPTQKMHHIKKELRHLTKLGIKHISAYGLIVEENTKLRKWYEENGAVHLGTHKFDFFPFTCGYMRKEL